MHPAYRLCLMLCLPVTLAACGDAAGSGELALIPIDSIPLQESDTAFIVEPYDLLMTPDGSLMVSDGSGGRLIVYSSDGSLRGTIGRKGSGPGEFAAPTQMAMGGDSLLYVVDGLTIKKLEMPSGEYIGSVTLSGIPGSLSIVGDRLVVGLADVQNMTSFVFSDDGGRTFAAAGLLPEILTSPIVGPSFGWIPVAASGNRVATAYIVTNSVSITDLTTGATDSVMVPVVNRWGSRTDAFAQLAETPSQELVEAAMTSSMPGAIAWLPSGRLAVVHTDATLQESRFVGGQYLSVVDADVRRTCGEVPIPGPTDPTPIIGFRGDTLIALSQRVAAGTARTFIHRHLIVEGSCRGSR